MTVQWANVIFLAALAVAASVLAAVLTLAWDRWRENRRLSQELAEGTCEECDRRGA